MSEAKTADSTVEELIRKYQERTEALKAEFPRLKTLPLTAHLLFLYTRIRDQNTLRKDFVFYSDRIIRILLEEALSLLPYSSWTVETPTNRTFEGVTPGDLSSSLCGVSILRAGAAMDASLRLVIRDIPIGKILIQRDESSRDKKAQLFYKKLPADIKNRTVLLLDPMLATGGSAVIAIQALIDEGVDQDRIIFVNLVSCPEGISAVLIKFPRVTILTGMVDEQLNEQKYILPGLGDFGDIYFGTHEAN